MPLDEALPYGLRDVKITPYTTGETLGTPIDLPNSQTFSFSEAEDFDELRGDDRTVTVRGKGPQVDWDLEAGGISLAAVKALYGGTITTTGTTPDQSTTWTKKGGDQRPYFKVEGQAISESGGDVHAVVHKCRCTKDFTGEFGDGKFFITGAGGTGIPKDSDDVLFELTENETAADIPIS